MSGSMPSKVGSACRGLGCDPLPQELMKTEASDNQLSGVGFSDTKRSGVLVRVKGNFTRTLRLSI